MKKNFTLVILLAYFISNSQCPAPSNIIVENIDSNVAQLSWTENGTATDWEIAVIPYEQLGTYSPLVGPYFIIYMRFIQSNPITYSDMPLGCSAVFIRSVCSSNFSPWTIIPNGSCTIDELYYIASLSNTSFDNQNLSISPNPTNSIININNKFSIKSVVLYDTLGRVLVTQEVNQSNYVLDISNQNKGVYLLKIVTDNGSIIEKIVKE